MEQNASSLRAAGIVAEYNPFHNGHAYHLKESKKLSGADFIIVVMSPDFTQRGEPAVISKKVRTRMALQGGADLVLELPVCFATGSAEYFAQGAVRILDMLGCVDRICFGCETPDTGLLRSAASLLLQEPPDYKDVLKSALKTGSPFPKAREEALSFLLSKHSADGQNAGTLPAAGLSGPAAAGLSPDLLHTLLGSPNNILALEYIKALIKRNSSILPIAIPRTGSGYHDLRLPGGEENAFASAAAIRRLAAGDPGSMDGSMDAASFMPEGSAGLFLEELKNRRVPSARAFDRMIRLCWLKKFSAPDSADLASGACQDLNDALAARMRSLCADGSVLASDLASLTDRLNTKELTAGRVRRALLHLLLGIRGDETEVLRSSDSNAYVRVLGFKKDAAPLLHLLKETASLPVITKSADAPRLLEGPALAAFRQDILASHIYQLLLEGAGPDPLNEYRWPPLIL